MVIVKDKLCGPEDNKKEAILSVALRHDKVKKRTRRQLRAKEGLVSV